ncbi:gametocyte-specific factor 1 homolog [Drosophila madeirensis]|uniref:Gametocyte-specific factor 1 homolog n=1 Tax=Drosophila madeirensis TaxID=30013 RepID=A0AAU9G881_DROMD
MENMENNGDYLICPYDKSHTILRSRMTVHMVRCSRNNTNSKKVRCPFNVTHLIDPNEMKNHAANCPNRSGFDRFIKPDKKPDVESSHCSEKAHCPCTVMNQGAKKKTEAHVKDCPHRSSYVPHVSTNQTKKWEIESTENWDDEPEVGTYDAIANMAKKFVIINPQGNTPSAKRAFREQERKRFQENGRF